MSEDSIVPTASAPVGAPPSAAAPRKRRALPWVLGSVAAVLIVALLAVVLFFRMPVYRMVVGDKQYVVAIEKSNATGVLQTAARGYAALPTLARAALSTKTSPTPAAASRVVLTAEFGIDDSLVKSLTGLTGTNAAAIGDAIRKLHLKLDATTDPGARTGSAALGVGFGTAKLLEATLFALQDGRFAISAPDLVQEYLVFQPSALQGEIPVPTAPAGVGFGAFSLAPGELRSILDNLKPDGTALAASLAAYGDLYGQLLSDSPFETLTDTSYAVGDVTVPCSVFTTTLTGDRFAAFLKDVLTRASTDQVLYNQTLGAIHSAIQASIDAAKADGSDVAGLTKALDAIPTFAKWTSSLAEAAGKATASGLGLHSVVQTLAIASDGTVVGRSITVVPETSANAATVTASYASVTRGGVVTTLVELHREGSLVLRSISAVRGDTMQGTMVLGGVVPSGDKNLTIEYTAQGSLALKGATFHAVATMDTANLVDKTTVTLDFAAATTTGTASKLEIDYASPAGKANIDLTFHAEAGGAVDLPELTASNSIDLANLSEEDGTALQYELGKSLPALFQTIADQSPDFASWLTGLFPAA